jgi:hypothetical protein
VEIIECYPEPKTGFLYEAFRTFCSVLSARITLTIMASYCLVRAKVGIYSVNGSTHQAGHCGSWGPSQPRRRAVNVVTTAECGYASYL